MRSSSPGRPPQYCDLPEHTRWRAWRERQRLQQEAQAAQEQTAPRRPADGTVPSPPPAPLAEAAPITTARLRAEDLLTRFAVQAEQLTATLQEATAAFTTMTDPAAAEAQVEAARIAAARQVADAEAARRAADEGRRSAERARRGAEPEAARAGEAAEAAVAAAGAAERMADAALAERDTARAERDEALAEREKALVQARERAAERDAA